MGDQLVHDGGEIVGVRVNKGDIARVRYPANNRVSVGRCNDHKPRMLVIGRFDSDPGAVQGEYLWVVVCVRLPELADLLRGIGQAQSAEGFNKTKRVKDKYRMIDKFWLHRHLSRT